MGEFVKVLLTGATGFVGKGLAAQLAGLDGVSLACAVRRPGSSQFGEEFVIGELQATTDWSAALAGQNVVVHAAARAHVMRDETANPLVEYRRVNVDGTLNLARQAAEAGVSRFVFVSSIKVKGNFATMIVSAIKPTHLP
jgi:nucleoside-diphosphate-sugar epimerase